MSTVLAPRIAWRRQNVPHHYVGALSVSGEELRLSGREPSTRIEVALSIPFEEIEDVRLAAGPAGDRAGGSSVVLVLAGSGSIVLREVERGSVRTAELAARLAKLVRCTREPGRATVAAQ